MRRNRSHIRQHSMQICLVLALVLSGFLSAQTLIDEASFTHENYWPRGSEPIRFIMGVRPPNINGLDFSGQEGEEKRQEVLRYLAGVSSMWQTAIQDINISYKILAGCTKGDQGVAGCKFIFDDPEGNGKSEIMFEATPRNGFGNALGLAKVQFELSRFCQVPRPDSRLCLKEKITEVDVFIQPRSTG